jgi:hypothetical protein
VINPIDTPDFQRGSFAPSKLIGAFGAGTNVETVNLPANAETVLIIKGSQSLTSVVGVTTGSSYPVVQPLPGDNGFYLVFVAPGADPQVTITWGANAQWTWYVVADAGVRLIADLILEQMAGPGTGGSLAPSSGLFVGGYVQVGINRLFEPFRTDAIGRSYTIPGVPATDTGDGPPYELKYYAGVLNAGAGVTIIAAPGAGKRIRIFYAKCRTFSGSASTVAATFGGVVMILVASGTTASSSDLDTLIVPLTGIATDANTPVVYTSSAGNPGLIAVVIYTVETI